jgi:hypothetical protein
MIISQLVLLSMRNVAGTICTENQNTHFVLNNLFFSLSKILPVYEIMPKNTVEPGRPQMTIWRMRIACWIPKAKNKLN